MEVAISSRNWVARSTKTERPAIKTCEKRNIGATSMHAADTSNRKPKRKERTTPHPGAPRKAAPCENRKAARKRESRTSRRSREKRGRARLSGGRGEIFLESRSMGFLRLVTGRIFFERTTVPKWVRELGERN